MSDNKEPRGFNKAKQKTEKLLKSREKLDQLLRSVKEKSSKRKEQLKDVWNNFQTLLRLVSAWYRQDYQEIPWKTILYATAALLYFVNPLDLIPDFLPITGFIDDITIISFVSKSLSKDLEKFVEWEKSTTHEE